MSKYTSMLSFANAGVTPGVPSNGNWPSANLAIYVGFAIPFPFKVKSVFWANGTTVTGNADVGVYSFGSTTRLFNLGATARAGASDIQPVNLGTPFLLGPGSYYMALTNTTTGSFFRWTFGTLSDARMTGLYQQATANPLPATATLAALTSAYWPLFGLSSLDASSY